MFYHHILLTMDDVGSLSNPVLSNPTFRDTYPILTERSVSLLRLMGTIIVALLAITMAILPISVPLVAVSVGHQHAMTLDGGHEHAALDQHREYGGVLASSGDIAVLGVSDHDRSSKDCDGVICCSMGTCHAFQVSVPPSPYSPAVSDASIVLARDEQVEGITADGLDRPPRTY